MIRSINRISLLLSLFLIANGCHPIGKCDHWGITVFNNSDKTIYGIRVFPKTMTGYRNPKSAGVSSDLHDSDAYRILSKGKNDEILREHGCLSDYLDRDSTNSIIVYFFDDSVLRTTPWDTIVAHNLYIKKDSFNYQEIVNRNWRLEYP